MTDTLLPLPSPPNGVRYALTVPQSVLFAELSLDGNRRWAFKKAMRMDYEPAFIAIDNGAMSWNCDDDADFERGLGSDESALFGLTRFVGTMASTARTLEIASRIYTPSSNRRSNKPEDIIEDLQEYWTEYKLHMTSLFTFWNVEYILSAALTKALTDIGRHDEIRNGLARFFKPIEENYFVLERRHLRRLISRFSPEKTANSSATREALHSHSNMFGFLLAPFNLGAPPSAEDILRRTFEFVGYSSMNAPNLTVDNFDDLPLGIRSLGFIAQQLTFWKTERLDIMSLADSRAQPLFEEAADELHITLQQLFTMTSKEIIDSLRSGALQVPTGLLAQRVGGFCLALVNGEISFYEATKQPESKEAVPLKPGESIRGVAASPGRVSGAARIIQGPDESTNLQSGEVLVTTMTRPEMGAALDLASAFVTDEGGLLCHAAIIAREMKKPCVIGTGCASYRLCQGDVVMVDGTAGLITRM